MPVESRKTAGNYGDLESDRHFALPCVSSLAIIPGFDQISHGKVYPKGSTLFVEGQAARGVYVLCSGRVKLSINSVDGKRLIMRIAGPGDLLGVHATLTGHSYEATAETFSRCRVTFATRRDLLGLLERQKLSSVGLAIAISREFTEFVEQARVLLLSATALQKLAGLLLVWSDAFGRPTPAGTHLQTLLTHEELGQMIGASRETVTRALAKLKRKQVIRATNGNLWIRNRAALVELARAVR